MKSVTITRHIESALLNIPELADFIGKDVEIRIEEREASSNSAKQWSALDRIMNRPDLIDDDLIRRQLDADLVDAQQQELNRGNH
jgi:uncharacterized protein YajQ (UPF0234 family)